ncbi:MAG: hypothetical protein ACRD0Y_04945 [Terriglobales bacterium]
MEQYLFNSSGEWIAFRDGKYIYDVHGEFLGFMAEGGADVADIESRYFASIYYGDRLYRKVFPPALELRYPGYPGTHARPDFPGFAESAPVPTEADDIPELVTA